MAKTPQPFRVITEVRCPCCNCAGELVQPAEIQEFASLAEAVRAYRKAEPEEPCFRGPEPDVTDGTHSFRWFSRAAQEFAEPQEPCSENEGEAYAWSVSLHPPEWVTEATRRRIARLIGIEPGPRWHLTMPADPFRPSGPLKRLLLPTGQDPAQVLRERYSGAEVKEDRGYLHDWRRRYKVIPPSPLEPLICYAIQDGGQKP